MRAKIQRLLEIRAQEGVVHHQRQIFCVGQTRGRSDVGHNHRGVRRSFHVQHARVGLDCRFHQIEPGSIDKAELHPEIHKQLGAQPEDSSVDRLRQNYVVARSQQAEDGINRSHSGRKYVGGFPGFEFGDGAFECFAVGMARARVVVPLVLAHFLDDVGRSLVDGGYDRTRRRIGFLSHVNRVRRKSHCSPPGVARCPCCKSLLGNQITGVAVRMPHRECIF